MAKRKKKKEVTKTINIPKAVCDACSGYGLVNPQGPLSAECGKCGGQGHYPLKIEYKEFTSRIRTEKVASVLHGPSYIPYELWLDL